MVEEQSTRSITEPARKATAATVTTYGLPMWMKLTMAIVSLLLGLFTPPLLIRGEVATADGDTATVEEPVCTADDGSCQETQEGEQFPGVFFPCNNATLDQFFYKQPVAGYHIICAKSIHDETKPIKDFLRLEYHMGGFRNTTVAQHFHAPYKWSQIKFAIERKLQLNQKKKLGEYQPWAIFTPLGQRVVDADLAKDSPLEELILDVLAKYQTVLLFEGGQFMWPGVEMDFERTIPLNTIMPIGDPVREDAARSVTLTTLSLDPLVLSVDKFLTEEECDYIKAIAEPSLEYSGVVLMDKDAGRPASDFRTSQSTFVSSNGNDILYDIELRVASLVRVPRQHQEDVQVLRYGPGEKYDHHTDFFDQSLYKNDPDTLKLIKNGARNRLATVFWYLSDVEAGGETAFPRAMGHEPESMQDCNTGLFVIPEKGKVIIFYSLKMDGTPDDKSLHGACPVKEGVKYAANKWVWNEPMTYVN